MTEHSGGDLYAYLDGRSGVESLAFSTCDDAEVVFELSDARFAADVIPEWAEIVDVQHANYDTTLWLDV